MTHSPRHMAALLKELIFLGVACAVLAGANIYMQSVRTSDALVSGGVRTSIGSLPQWALATDAAPWSEDYSPETLTTDAAEIVYGEHPSVGDKIGSLSIPKLKTRLPIIEGTGVKELERGVGHFVQSVLPGQNDNCVLSGHRDTVFGDLGALEIGDLFVVQTDAGTFTYQIRKIRIVDKDDKTVIVPTDHAVLTVTTCYPFRYIGSAPDRYILSADLLEL